MGGAINNSVPNGFVPTIRGNMGRNLLGNTITNCPMRNIGVRICSNSFRPISSSRMTFGVTNSHTFHRTVTRTGPSLLRPVVRMGVSVPSDCVNTIANSLGRHHNHILNVRVRSGLRVVATRMPVTRLFRCPTRLHDLANSHKDCRVRFIHCSVMPSRVTGGVTRDHRDRLTVRRR